MNNILQKGILHTGLPLMLLCSLSLPSLTVTAKAQAAPIPIALEKPAVARLNTVSRKDWPSPVSDNESISFLLISLLEYQRTQGKPAEVRWDIVGWRGGDKQRIWFKTEGSQPLLSRSTGKSDVQLLYGRQVAPFFDLQTGVRYEQANVAGGNRTRASAVLALQGLAPGNFQVDSTLFLSQDGQVSGRFTGTYDLYLSQRLVLQPRLETEVALQSRERIGIGSGLNNVDLGLRLRYEIRREFAPYVGISSSRNYGVTAGYLRREGTAISQLSVVAGVQMWL